MAADPTRIAATRSPSWMPSAGVVTLHCCCTCSSAGLTSMRVQAAETASPKASSHGRSGGGSMSTTAVSRMCSPRPSAITAPSMASQRNSADASSSDQTSGRFST